MIFYLCPFFTFLPAVCVGYLQKKGSIVVCFDYVQFFITNDGAVFGLVYQFPYNPSRPFLDETEQLIISDPDNRHRFFTVAMSALDTMIVSLEGKNTARALARFEDAKLTAFSVYIPYYQKHTLHIPEYKIRE